MARWYPSYSIPVFRQAGISSGVARLVPEQWFSPIHHANTKDISARPPKFTNTHHGSEQSKRYLRRNRQFTVPRLGYLWTQHWFGRPFQSSACVCRKIAIFSWWVWSREIPRHKHRVFHISFFQTLLCSQTNDERTKDKLQPFTSHPTIIQHEHPLQASSTWHAFERWTAPRHDPHCRCTHSSNPAVAPSIVVTAPSLQLYWYHRCFPCPHRLQLQRPRCQHHSRRFLWDDLVCRFRDREDSRCHDG
jgi:hypothetical protein